MCYFTQIHTGTTLVVVFYRNLMGSSDTNWLLKLSQILKNYFSDILCQSNRATYPLILLHTFDLEFCERPPL
jgi:hypothetical protein